jgi:hypothetical protein
MILFFLCLSSSLPRGAEAWAEQARQDEAVLLWWWLREQAGPVSVFVQRSGGNISTSSHSVLLSLERGGDDAES